MYRGEFGCNLLVAYGLSGHTHLLVHGRLCEEFKKGLGYRGAWAREPQRKVWGKMGCRDFCRSSHPVVLRLSGGKNTGERECAVSTWSSVGEVDSVVL